LRRDSDDFNLVVVVLAWRGWAAIVGEVGFGERRGSSGLTAAVGFDVKKREWMEDVAMA